jgi:protein subunit release factor B
MSGHKFSTTLEEIEKEIEISFYKSSGPGGQRKNKKETAVKLYHPLSGITVIATEERSQARNRELALKRLQEKLIELNKGRKKRIPTKPPEYVKEKILQEKKIRGNKKILRGKIRTPMEQN